eukprot:GEZU01027974.1.p1 GENE.GEZU01027974.1~~GEZU01027974.1.p1  ORF type:complete len:124 (-),score=6.19 GEZU01027974.1:84-455(-)
MHEVVVIVSVIATAIVGGGPRVKLTRRLLQRTKMLKQTKKGVVIDNNIDPAIARARKKRLCNRAGGCEHIDCRGILNITTAGTLIVNSSDDDDDSLFYYNFDYGHEWILLHGMMASSKLQAGW